MTLTTDCTFIFVDFYAYKSVEDIEQLLEEEKQNIQHLIERFKNMPCQCPVKKLLRIQVDSKGECLSSFKNIHNDRLCATCQQSLEDFPVHMRAAGMAPTDHWHPQLMLGVAHYIKNILEDAIFCKNMNYSSLSLEEIRSEAIQVRDSLEDLEMEKIMHDNDDNEELLNEIEFKKQILSGLEFELKSRALRGLIQLDVASSV